MKTIEWIGAGALLAATCLPRASHAHDVGPEVKLPGVFSVGTGLAVAHHWLEVDSTETSAGLLGPLLQLQLEKEISSRFRTGAQLQGAFFLPTGDVLLGTTSLQQPANVLVSLLWVSRIQPFPNCSEFGLLWGVGPALNHFAEGSGAFFEATSFGAAEQLGIEFNLFPSHETVHPYISLLFLSSQTLTGNDRPSTTDSVFSAGGMVTFRLTFGEKPNPHR